ncbi:MAG: response regulator [Gammaproteobacteria bacterium]
MAELESIQRIEEANARAHNYQILGGSIAHEMRNPLGQVSQALAGISDRLPAEFPRDGSTPVPVGDLRSAHQLLEQGRMAASRGSQVIAMLLEQVHDKPMDSTGLTTESVADLVRKALEEYSYGAETERRAVHAELNDDFYIKADATSVVFVLFNLMKNAFYYLAAHPDAEVTISLEPGQQANRLLFRDTGPGIAPDALPTLFDGFHSVGKRGGTGLGLPYCRRVMRALGGDIVCRSSLGEYTEFELRFPTIAAAELERDLAATLAAAHEAFGGAHILVVDDDAGARALAGAHLADVGVSMSTAKDGVEALEVLRHEPADVLILDLNMPVMDGYRTARAIRAGEAGAQVADCLIVAHSSEPEFLARPRARRAGMDALIIKPCGRERFLRALTQARIDHREHAHAEGLLNGRRLLLVDDSDTARTLFNLAMERSGARIVDTRSPVDALALIEAQAFDIVITDIKMPGMNGFELARRIRAIPEREDLPILGLSGADSSDFDPAEASTMDHIVAKGIDTKSLIRVAESLLARSLDNAHSSPRGDTAFPPRADAPRAPASEPSPRIHPGMSASTPDPTPDPTHLEIDWAKAAARIGTRPEVLKGSAAELLARNNGVADRLEPLLDAGDFDQLGLLAHTLKGQGRMLGITELEYAGDHLERACRNADRAAARDGTAALSRVTQAFFAALAREA